MVRIRLKRMGAKKRPFYRIIIADSRSPRDGRFIESIGFYDPLTKPATVKIKPDLYEQWIKNGAQPSEAVVKILKRSQALENAARSDEPITPNPAADPSYRIPGSAVEETEAAPVETTSA